MADPDFVNLLVSRLFQTRCHEPILQYPFQQRKLQSNLNFSNVVCNNKGNSKHARNIQPPYSQQKLRPGCSRLHRWDSTFKAVCIGHLFHLQLILNQELLVLLLYPIYRHKLASPGLAFQSNLRLFGLPRLRLGTEVEQYSFMGAFSL